MLKAIFLTKSHQPFLFFTIIFLNLSYLQPLPSPSYSYNYYPFSSLLTFSHYYQLSTLDIIGISTQGKLTFSYQASTKTYQLTYDNSNNFLDFITSIYSKEELSLPNNKFLVPCALINSTYKEVLLIDLDTKEMTPAKSTEVDLDEIQNHHCGITNKDNETYIISYINNPSNETYLRECFVLGYDIRSPSRIFILTQFNHCRFYNKGQNSCVYIKKYDKYLCFIMDEYRHKDRLVYGMINENGYGMPGNISSFNLTNYLISGYLNGIDVKIIDDSNCLVIAHFAKFYFYVFFVNVYGEDSKHVNIYADYTKRYGKYESLKYLRINDDYFILYDSLHEINSTNTSYGVDDFNCGNQFYFYLFNIQLKKQINKELNPNFLSSYSSIIFNYQKDRLILVNQVKNQALDLYEFDLIQCMDRLIIKLHENEQIINISKIYNSTDEDILISFFELELPLNIQLLGRTNSTVFENVATGLDNFYSEIKINHNLNETVEINFKYVLKETFKYFNIPSYLCLGSLIFQCQNNCKYCSDFGNEQEHSCTECNNDYFRIYYGIEELDNKKIFNCYKNLKGYYLNNDQKYEKCYGLCSTCSKKGDILNNNCDSCISGYELLSFYTLNPNDKNCVKFCEKAYFTWYVDKNTKELICNYNYKCPDFTKLNNQTNECVFSNETLYQKYINNKNIYDITQYEYEAIVDLLLNDSKIFFNPLQDEIISDNFSLSFYEGLNNDYIEFTNECIGKIYQSTNSNKVNLAILEENKNSNNFYLFNEEGELLDISSICEDDYYYSINQILNESLLSDIEKAIQMNSTKNIDVFDSSDKFFNDYCQKYSENDKDIPVSLRRELYYQNDSICTKNNCLLNTIINSSYVQCRCSVNNLTASEKNEFKKVSDSSLKYMKCIKSLFSKNIFTNNGFLITFPLGVTCSAYIIMLIKSLLKGPNIENLDFIINSSEPIGNLFDLNKKVNPMQPPIKIKKSKQNLITHNSNKNILSFNNKNNEINNNNIALGFSNILPNSKIEISNANNNNFNILNKKERSKDPTKGKLNDNIKTKRFENSNKPIGDDQTENNSLSLSNTIKNAINDIKGKSLNEIIQKKIFISRLFFRKVKLEQVEKLNRIIILLSLYLFTFFFNTLLYSDNYRTNLFIEENNDGKKINIYFNITHLLISSLAFGLYSLFIHIYIYITQKYSKILSIVCLIILIFVDIFLVYDVSTFCSVNTNCSINVAIQSLLTIFFDIVFSFFFGMLIFVGKNYGAKKDWNWLLLLCQICYYF